MTRNRMSNALLTLALDVVVPLAAFYLARAAGLNQWLALVIAAIAPIIGIAVTWARTRRLDPTAVFVIAAMALSLLIALFTGDARVLLARESWLTGAIGLWVLGTLVTSRPFLLDVAGKISPPRIAERIDALWSDNRVFRRWLVLASIAWGAAFLLDAIVRVVLAYTMDIDRVPVIGTVTLVVLICLAQGVVMLVGRRSGALALIRGND